MLQRHWYYEHRTDCVNGNPGRSAIREKLRKRRLADLRTGCQEAASHVTTNLLRELETGRWRCKPQGCHLRMGLPSSISKHLKRVRSNIKPQGLPHNLGVGRLLLDLGLGKPGLRSIYGIELRLGRILHQKVTLLQIMYFIHFISTML